ncbi:MAG: LamG-like jellyroll fold domain-containing protein [Niastella sp.]|jgi:hypothetical protein|uniref:LamG-like jellyroll fold domain-containing protein n=1 Tax=Niastella sp. TaxID=1869183 RepID=UPI00389AD4AE
MKMTVKNIRFIMALLAVAAIYASCTKGPNIKNYTYPAPEPQGVTPAIGFPTSLVTINGSTFGDYKNVVKVFFNGIESDSILSCEDGKIVARVPVAAISGPAKVGLQVWTNIVDSIGTFTVKAPPTIKTADPLTGLPGDTVRIYGTGYGTDMAKVNVTFKGIAATIASLEDTVITTTVPVGTSSGDIAITVEGYPVKGPGFSILVSVPTPVYALDFENNLVDRISGVAATYNKGTAGDITYEPGQRGLAARFPGFTPTTWNNSGTVSIPPAIMPVFKQREFTVTCWVNWAAGRNIYPDPIFEFGEVRGTRITFLTRMGSGSNSWNGSASRMVGRYLLTNKVPVGGPTYTAVDDYVIASNAPVLPYDWRHVAFVFSYSKLTMKIYINGVEVGTKNITRADEDPFLMTINKASIGGYAFGSGTETNYAGLMDNFRIYNQALSADQIYTDFYKK